VSAVAEDGKEKPPVEQWSYTARSTSSCTRSALMAMRPVGRRAAGRRPPPTGLRLLLADHDITLGPGGAAESDTRVPHPFGPAGDQPVEVLRLLGRQGERIHVRAAPRRRTDGQRNPPRNHHTGHQVM
jgi:hypothetical protein